MRDAYGFGLPRPPELREARVGDWRVVRHLPSLAEGYGTGPCIEPRRFVLYHRRTAWMSSGLMELESHAWHVHQARGVVVTAGLGIGLYAYACCARDDVSRLIVIEREPAVVDLFERATRRAHWEGRYKLTILITDARSQHAPRAVADALAGQRPDYLFVDIWPSCAAPEAPGETAAMVAQLRPRAAGWWGQELSFGLWCRQHGRDPAPASLDDYWNQCGVPVAANDGYSAFCRDVINACLPGPTTVVPGIWQRLLGRLR